MRELDASGAAASRASSAVKHSPRLRVAKRLSDRGALSCLAPPSPLVGLGATALESRGALAPVPLDRLELNTRGRPSAEAASSEEEGEEDWPEEPPRACTNGETCSARAARRPGAVRARLNRRRTSWLELALCALLSRAGRCAALLCPDGPACDRPWYCDTVTVRPRHSLDELYATVLEAVALCS